MPKYAIALVYLYGSKVEEGLRYLRGENIKIDDRLTYIDVGCEALKGYCVYSIDKTFKENYEEMILRRAADLHPFLELYLKEALEEV